MSNPKDKNQEKRDVTFMKRVLKLAERGRGYVSPNPMVGALVIKDGEVVGKVFMKNMVKLMQKLMLLTTPGTLLQVLQFM